jgi:hypothetical protein
MDNMLLAISHHMSRRSHTRDRSWGGSTINEDNDTAGLISKYQSNTHTPRSGPPSAALSQVQTRYSPYDSPQQRDFAPPNVHLSAPSKATGGIRTPDSGITLRDRSEERRDGSFSYQNTPVDMAVDGLGIGFAVSPLEQESNTSGKRRTSRGGYESLTGVDERVYNGEQYANRPVRMNAVKEV